MRNRRKMLLLLAKKKSGGGSIWKQITGSSPLTLLNAKNSILRKLKQYGKCTQASTPTPSSPVDIKCNNGALKWDSVNHRIYVDGTPEVLSITAEDEYEEDEYEGDIVTFDSTSSMNIAELSVDIDPIQDLRGYDNPWPSGGGKNKFDSSLMANAVEATKYITLNLKPNTEYTMSSDDPSKDGGTYADLFFCNVGESTNSKMNGVKLNQPVTRTSDENGQLRVWYRRYKTWITPEQLIAYHTQVEEGSTPTAWTPFSNICPISGWTGCEILHTGKNMIPSIDDTAFWDTAGYFNGNGTITVRANYKTSTYLPVIGGCQYVFSTFNANKTTVSGWKGLLVYDSNKQPLRDAFCENNATKVTITIPDEGSYIRMYTILADNIAYPQLELGSTATSYEAFSGTTYPIPLGQTVYGGTLDVVNGKMYARPYYPSYNGETLVGPWVSSMDKYEEGATPTAGAQVVDMGGTVTEISLTPEEITLLEGENNLWSDAGAVDVVVERAAKQTASVADLFAVGDYKDEQDIISGLVTRKCRAKVLDGTEAYTKANSGDTVRFRLNNISDLITGSSGRIPAIYSHFQDLSSTSSQSLGGAFAFSGRVIYFIPTDQTLDLNGWKSWVAQQYAEGTPLIVIYPLAQETTESVTPQELHSYAGDTTVSWTAEVDGTIKTIEYAQGKQASNKVGTAKVGVAKAG